MAGVSLHLVQHLQHSLVLHAITPQLPQLVTLEVQQRLAGCQVLLDLAHLHLGVCSSRHGNSHDNNTAVVTTSRAKQQHLDVTGALEKLIALAVNQSFLFFVSLGFNHSPIACHFFYIIYLCILH